MITGVHALIYTKEADELRAFFRDVLQFPHVDVGHGWLIFRLPPAELAIHPSEDETGTENAHELYLLCDELNKTVADLTARGVQFARPITEAPYGLMTAIKLPGGGEMGLYEPRHPTAISVGKVK
jgi:predicted enzyme related to lactoylglutathione lyase